MYCMQQFWETTFYFLYLVILQLTIVTLSNTVGLVCVYILITYFVKFDGKCKSVLPFIQFMDVYSITGCLFVQSVLRNMYLKLICKICKIVKYSCHYSILEHSILQSFNFQIIIVLNHCHIPNNFLNESQFCKPIMYARSVWCSGFRWQWNFYFQQFEEVIRVYYYFRKEFWGKDIQKRQFVVICR